jgi:hypothetical protein
MGSFLHPGLLGPAYAAVIAAVSIPVVIHLINMLRHRRVEWAAMEFLLLSQKKNRTWIVLKQLLLLLLRMTAMAAVVFMVAQPLLRNRLGDWFGSSTTHHIVLLDDSYSMSDRWQDTSAIDEAKKAIRRLGEAAAEQVHAQTFTLMRFSQAGRNRQPDLLSEPVNRTDFPGKLDDALQKIRAGQLAVGPAAALRAVSQLLGEGHGEARIVYLMSDFRLREWDDPAELRTLLKQLGDAGADLHLVHCVDQARPNLTIRDLALSEGIQAAGVPFFMEVEVQNFGDAPARDVPVLLEEDGRARPAVTIPRIPPGQSAKERFLVHFPTAGPHQVTARLEADAVAADNARFATLSLPAEVPVLLVDGDPRAIDARYVGIASAPGGAVRTGLRPQIETPRFLDLRSLADFHAINLLNIERLDRSGIEALETFVRAGGGVAVFLGERSRAKFINDELHRDGEGFFPCPVEGPAELLVDRLERAPDVRPEDHFVFRVFSDPGNVFVESVNVERYFAVPRGWKPAPDSTVRVIARLRNDAPLVVEQKFGEGRVVAFLTTAGPAWNNWARNPSFVVMVQDLQAYLARRPAIELSRPVGMPLELSLAAAEFQPEVRLVTPEGGGPGGAVGATAMPDGSLSVSFDEIDAAGYYQAILTRTDGAAQTRHYALNVDPAEGDLATVNGEMLAARLEGIDYRYEQAARFQYSMEMLAGYNLGDSLLYLLLLLLIVEQVLAWSASYHPSAPRAAAKGGAA